MGVAIRTLRWQQHRFPFGSRQNGLERRREFRVAVHEHIALLTALKNRATFALKNGPPSSQHFFATNALHPAAEGICGEKMFPGTLGAGPRESAKVASFESAVDMSRSADGYSSTSP